MKYTADLARAIFEDCQLPTLDEIAEKYDIPTRSSVRRILTKYGFPSVVGIRRKQFSLSDHDLGYIAGIIDGEGHITAEPRLAVTNTSLSLLEYLKNKLGGSICVHSLGTDKHRQTWIWRLSTIPTKSILPLLLPYLIVKKSLAQNFL